MLPKKVKKRASLLAILLFTSVMGAVLILIALNKNILYFNSPTDIKISQDINFDKKIRVGGMVKKDTLNIKEKNVSLIHDFNFNTSLNIDSSSVHRLPFLYLSCIVLVLLSYICPISVTKYNQSLKNIYQLLADCWFFQDV